MNTSTTNRLSLRDLVAQRKRAEAPYNARIADLEAQIEQVKAERTAALHAAGLSFEGMRDRIAADRARNTTS